MFIIFIGLILIVAFIILNEYERSEYNKKYSKENESK